MSAKKEENDLPVHGTDFFDNLNSLKTIGIQYTFLDNIAAMQKDYLSCNFIEKKRGISNLANLC
jgi:hypothetical protein